VFCSLIIVWWEELKHRMRMGMSNLTGKTIFITGASRGIGRAIALRCAKEGAHIILAAKTKDPHPKLPGTIHSVAEEVEGMGGHALPIQLDVRNEMGVSEAMQKAADYFGGIDILVNNASAIALTPTAETTAAQLDLMMAVNVRATFLCAQAVLPYLIKASNPHILNLSPPLSMDPKWFRNHLAYTISKYGISMCTLGMAEEFKGYGIAVNSLWPKTTIATSAIEVHFPREILNASRKPEIVADAAYVIFNKDSRMHTGNFYIDEQVLRAEGITHFDEYALYPKAPLFSDLFVENGV
jgi:citronellol/citronellal dehydrogenase